MRPRFVFFCLFVCLFFFKLVTLVSTLSILLIFLKDETFVSLIFFNFLFSISLISDVYYFLFLLHLVLCCFLLYRSLEWELRLLIWNFPSFVVYAIENNFFNTLLYLTYLTSHSARFRSISNIYLKTDLVCHPQRVSLKFWIL